MTARLQSRAGRYTPWRERPDLCDEAERRFGLSETTCVKFDGVLFVAGDDRQGRLRLYHADTWTLIEPSPEPIGERAEQGRLL